MTMTKAQMKNDADRHIASTKGVDKNKRKGYREKAWVECQALEMIRIATWDGIEEVGDVVKWQK